jgi:hemimethylated DNA binding protein|tara:strand:- start:191 stop:871 length:681 start_codon:yes stop_codon:yes gene_type:complete
MSLVKTMYRQLMKKSMALDHLLASKRGLLPRRELNRFIEYFPVDIYNMKDEELDVLAKDKFLFRSSINKIFKDNAQDVDLESMFDALRIANNRIDQINDIKWIAKPESVKFDVGTIFRHKKWGFKGVIYSWYETCPADKNWAERYGPFEDGLSQPFYHCLIDSGDRPPTGFHSLAAQENLVALLPSEVAGEPVSHEMADAIFEEGYVVNGRHVLKAGEHKEMYPDD